MSAGELLYLDFDYSEEADESGCFDAMASVWPHQAPLVEAEVRRVIDWADGAFGGQHAPLEDGGLWFHDLQVGPEPAEPGAPAGQPGRVRYTLSVVGCAAFCEAFLAEFNLN